MMTPQEVAGAAFAKAAIGGYNMAAVDAFLDKLTEDYSALYKENSTLKAKMKVLVDKVDEYRQVDDSMRGALLAAQKMAQEMVSEAEAKRDSLLAEAEQTRRSMTAEAERAARARAEELHQAILTMERRQREVIAESDRLAALEKERLEKAKAATVEFVTACRALCQEHLDLLDRLPDLKPEAPRAAQEGPVFQAAELPSMEVFKPTVPETPPAPVPPPPPPAEETLEQTIVVPQPPEREAPAPEEPAPKEPPRKEDGDTRVIKLNRLQFGRNYRGGE